MVFKNGQIVVDRRDIVFNSLKMEAVHHVGFKKRILNQLLMSRWSIYIILQNSIKIGQRLWKIAIFRFQYGGYLPSWIFKILNFYRIVLGGQICFTIPNFIKIGQTGMEIFHLTVFKMAPVRRLKFLQIGIFEQPLRPKEPTCLHHHSNYCHHKLHWYILNSLCCVRKR